MAIFLNVFESNMNNKLNKLLLSNDTNNFKAISVQIYDALNISNSDNDDANIENDENVNTIVVIVVFVCCCCLFIMLYEYVIHKKKMKQMKQITDKMTEMEKVHSDEDIVAMVN